MEENERIKKAVEEPDVEGHARPKRDDAPTIEREAVARDDEPDVEAHRIIKGG